MRGLSLTLITGRSTKQGTGISSGKEHSEYQEATNAIELSQQDMQRLGLREGDAVKLKTNYGTAEVRCRRADIPDGLAFMAFGQACNCLVGNDTSASGTPDSKHLKVEIRAVGREHSAVRE